MPSNAIRSETLIGLRAEYRKAANSIFDYTKARGEAARGLDKAQDEYERLCLIVRLLEQEAASLSLMIKELEREENPQEQVAEAQRA